MRPVDEQFSYVVNCSFPHSFRLLNPSQHRILQAINGVDDIPTIGERLEIPYQTLEQFLYLLNKTEIIGFDDHFSTPQKPAKPNSINFWIHTTNACNLGCSYCYISTLNTSGGMTEAVREQLLYKMLEVVTSKGIRHIKLRLAGGEPLGQFQIWKEFIPRAKKALAEAGCRFDTGFVTNLTMLDEEMIAFSKAHDIGFGVSLDGVANVHDSTRSFRSGCGSFGMVDTNLRRLLAEGITVYVNTVISNLNLIGLPDLTRYLISLDIPFRYSVVKGIAIDAGLLEEYLSQSYTIMGESVTDGWQFSNRFQFCDLKPNELGFQTCASGFSGGAIYVDGSFNYCHVHFGENNSDTKLSIFDGEMDLVDMIGRSGNHQEARSDECGNCRYRSVCTSGCPVYRVDGKDPQCSLYHLFIPKYYELQAFERIRLLR